MRGGKPGAGRPGRRTEFVSLEGRAEPPPRMPTGIAELDRVLGGGLVPASAVLVGGDPGIGKSTLMLQAAAADGAGRAQRCSTSRARSRWTRCGCAPAGWAWPAPPCGWPPPSTWARSPPPWRPSPTWPCWSSTAYRPCGSTGTDSAPGTVTQVRGAGFELIRQAKTRGFALILVGHVTKEGTLAGPRVLEHMVDAVLHFEGDRGHQFRILRGAKNRFGATDEIGVFEMTERGLAEVANPSALFLAERRGNIAGSAVFAGLEGTRPVLVEVQALLAPAWARRRAAPWWAGTAGGWRCCWRCWRRAAACAWAHRTSTSTSPAGCA